MSVVQIGLLLLASFFLMLALSVPVSISLIVSSLVTVSAALPLDLSTFVACQKMVSGVDSFSLLAVPFFILTGVLMNTGGIAQRLINLAKAVSPAVWRTPTSWATPCSARCPAPQ